MDLQYVFLKMAQGTEFLMSRLFGDMGEKHLHGEDAEDTRSYWHSPAIRKALQISGQSFS